MIKRILLTIVIIIVVFLGLGYCVGKKSTNKDEVNINKSEININLDNINSELSKIQNTLVSIGNNVITVWQNTLNNKTITKQDMAVISNIKYNTFLENTKGYAKETYNNGLEAAKVEISYYNNLGVLPNIRKSLMKLKNQLDSAHVKNEVEYNSTLIKYKNIEELQELVNNPSGDFNTYKNNLYSKE